MSSQQSAKCLIYTLTNKKANSLGRYNWFVFDQYQTFIYGIRFLQTFYGVKVAKLSLFTRKYSKFLKIKFHDYLPPNQSYGDNLLIPPDSLTAASKKGRFLGFVLQFVVGQDESCFFLIKIETATVETYKIVNENGKKFFSRRSECLQLLCMNENVWILVVSSYTTGDRRLESYYRLSLNKQLGVACAVFVTENGCRTSSWTGKKYLLTDGQLYVVDLDGRFNSSEINVYNFKNNLWQTFISRVDSNVCDSSVYEYHVFAQNNHLIALSHYKLGLSLKYDLTRNVWCSLKENMNWNTLVCDDFSKACLAVGSHSFAVVQGKIWLKKFRCIQCYQNVLNLKDLCFLKVFSTYIDSLNTLTEERILEQTILADLPQSLKRRYFGPKHTWQKKITL